MRESGEGCLDMIRNTREDARAWERKVVVGLVTVDFVFGNAAIYYQKLLERTDTHPTR